MSVAARHRLVVLAFGVLGVSGVLAQGAGAAPAPRYYTTALSQPAVTVGATAGETFTLTNRSLIPLGSAHVAIPSGYAVSVVSVTGPKPSWLLPRRDWIASVSGDTLSLQAKTILGSLFLNESVTVRLSVLVPCVGASSAAWTSQASGSLPFLPVSGFVLAPGTVDPSLSPSGACSLKVGAIASPQTAGRPITVSVQALDGNGAPTTAFSGPGTLTGTFGAAPDGTSPAYSTLTFVNGQAGGAATAFGAQSGRTVTAAASGVTSGTSNAFDVQPGAPAQLEFQAEPPAKTQVNDAMTPGPEVDVYDGWGNLETVNDLAHQVTVSLALGSNPTGASLGASSQLSSGGKATFGSLSVTKSGNAFTLVASSGALTTDTSTSFDVFDAICTGECTATSPDNSATVNANANVDLQFSPSAALGDCGSGTSTGALLTIDPTADYTASSPLKLNLAYPAGSIESTVCVSKDGGSTWSAVGDCQTHDTGAYVALPCVENRAWLNLSDHGDSGFSGTLVLTSSDPIAGLG
jgi:hypothetical protein